MILNNEFKRKVEYIINRYPKSTNEHKAKMLLILCNKKKNKKLCPFCENN